MSIFRWFPSIQKHWDIGPRGGAKPRGFGVYVPQLEKCEVRLALAAVPWMPLDAGIDHATANIDEAELILSDNSLAVPQEVSPQAIGGLVQSGANQAAAQYGLTGAGQTVAIIDSGIAYDHYGLGQGYGPGHRVVGGWDFAENDANPYDDGPGGYHGTHVAGIIGADYGSNQGIATGVDFVALRVFDDYAKGDMAWTEAALRWVHENRSNFASPITTVNLSLGASWNSATPPSWASLEDELATLQQDGIVVVVSAGNAFQQHLTEGLSYPASSPYVFPVASLDANGQMSDFSQRDSRVIAAPGRGIESTVPDYFFGKDGIVNDWAKSSGTSMAAPFVTGASVLVREAMEIAGVSDISPQLIYDTLRNTASDVFDSITGSTYKALDIGAAIRSVFPADDHSDDLAGAVATHAQSHWTTAGWMNSLGDQDVFKVTADKAGQIAVHFDSDQLSHESLTLLRDGHENSLTSSDGTWTFNVAAGETIGVRLTDGISIGKYQLDWSFAALEGESGSVGHAPTSGTPTSNYPPTGNSSVGSTPITPAGNLPAFATLQGDLLTIRGDANANNLSLDLSSGIRVSVDGVSHQWSTDAVKNIEIRGMENNDSIRIVGSALADKIELHPGRVDLSNTQLNVSVFDVENVQFIGGGGADRAYLYDADTDDRLMSYPNKAILTGVGYSFTVDQVDRIFVHALKGGNDQAFVYDSSGNDVLSVRPQFSSITGPGYFNYLSGFERVYAYANNGGVDSALLYDSAGDDFFSTSGEVTSIVGAGFSTFARGFSNVEAFSSEGGNDRAQVHAPHGAKLTSGPDFVGMDGGGKTSVARNFGTVEMFQEGVSVPLEKLSLFGISEPISETNPQILRSESSASYSLETEQSLNGDWKTFGEEKIEILDQLQYSLHVAKTEESLESALQENHDLERFALNTAFSRF